MIISVTTLRHPGSQLQVGCIDIVNYPLRWPEYATSTSKHRGHYPVTPEENDHAYTITATLVRTDGAPYVQVRQHWDHSLQAAELAVMWANMRDAMNAVEDTMRNED